MDKSKSLKPTLAKSMVRRRPISLSVLFLWLLGMYDGTCQTNDPKSVSEAIQAINSGDYALVSIEKIANAHATEGIPGLEKQFSATQDLTVKAKIAEALIRLGNRSDVYWQFLVKLATPAILSDAPTPIAFDSDGRALPGYSPALVAWAKKHDLPISSAYDEVVYTLPNSVRFLAGAGDPRSIPLLRQALKSTDLYIQIIAARGLAELADEDAVPLIIDACKGVPKEAASPLAESLLYFKDSRAEAFAENVVPKTRVDAIRTARMHNATPLHPDNQ